MYQSKAKKTNPGSVQSQQGQRYNVIEVTPTSRNSEWFRVKVQGVRPARWIAANGGKRSIQQGSASRKTNTSRSAGNSGDSCRTAGRHDANVLALTWQPAFCESKNDRPGECKKLKANSFAANNFSLHGLWPNRRSCSKDYGFCGAVRSKRSFCSYPSLKLISEVRSELARVMPNSAQRRGCLQHHEYWKHGSCLTTDANAYYNLPIALTDAFNKSEFVTHFMRRNIGRTVFRDNIKQTFESEFRAGSARRLQLACTGGMLIEVRLQFPPNYPNIPICQWL